MHDIEHIRVPDEILFPMNSLCERFPEVATLKADGGLKLRNLMPAEKVALDVLPIIGYVDEIIDNINLVISDLEQLAADARAFGDRHPFNRYKLIVRTFFYEYGRFEDAFGYYTLWFQQRGHISKGERRELRHSFFAEMEDLVKIRNVCLHDEPNWSKSITPEVIILDGMDLFQVEVRNRKGELLQWESHLGPLCLKMKDSFYARTAAMRTTWNMLFAHAVKALVDQGKLQQAKRRFIPKTATSKGTRISELELVARDLRRAKSSLERQRQTKAPG